MVKFKLSVAGLATLMMCGALFAAEPAGRVLILQGSAVAVRASQEVPLARGAQVESGDLIKVGDGSSLQIRFVDESVVALRAGTQFAIKDFKFSEKGDQDRSIFGLLKGGMRTITGLIGKRDPRNYSVETGTATIGIRGTHYTALRCAGDCRNDDGSLAEDGLYGAVTEGRIVVANQAGETEFSRDEYFMVAGPNVLPRGLIAPPDFLRERIPGLARNTPGTPQGAAAVVMAGGAGNTGSVQNSASVMSAQLIPVGLVPSGAAGYVPMESPGVQVSENILPGSPGGGGLPGTGGPYLSFALVESMAELNPFLSSSADALELSFADSSATGGYDFISHAQATGQTMVDLFMNAQTINTVDESITKQASVDTGSSAAGNVSWGRYFESGTEIATGNSWSGYYHWAVGDPVTALPTAGVFTYSAVGGTNPTNQNGDVGTMSSRGQWTVDFGGMTIGTSQPITWSMPSGANFSVSMPQQGFSIMSMSPSTGVTVKAVDAAIVNTSCSGACSTVSSEIGVAFMGANAEGMGAAISTLNGSEAISSVQVYKR